MITMSLRKTAFTVLVIFFTLHFSQSAKAADPVGVTGHVTSIGTGWGGEAFYFGLDNNLNTCTSPSRYAIPTTPVLLQYKELVAELMLAFTTGKTVTVYYKGCYSSSASVVSVGVNQ